MVIYCYHRELGKCRKIWQVHLSELNLSELSELDKYLVKHSKTTHVTIPNDQCRIQITQQKCDILTVSTSI